MSEFTKGPWHVGANGTIIYAADNYAVANAIVFHGHHEGQMEANAQLIAAAPDLLEALESALPYLTMNQKAAGPTRQAHIAYCLSAIKKAKGMNADIILDHIAIAKATGAA